jgi:hypothetical protein
VSRRAHDFYETAPWQTQALLAHIKLQGTVLEPCAGDGSISRIIVAEYFNDIDAIFLNDIDPKRNTVFNEDAATTVLYGKFHGTVGTMPDWIVTNPPYKMPTCFDIVRQAVKYARLGVAMMLRISFREPTELRGPWFMRHPPSKVLTLPRYSFTGNGKSDSATTEWLVWEKFERPDNILSLYGVDDAN